MLLASVGMLMLASATLGATPTAPTTAKPTASTPSATTSPPPIKQAPFPPGRRVAPVLLPSQYGTLPGVLSLLPEMLVDVDVSHAYAVCADGRVAPIGAERARRTVFVDGGPDLAIGDVKLVDFASPCANVLFVVASHEVAAGVASPVKGKPVTGGLQFGDVVFRPSPYGGAVNQIACRITHAAKVHEVPGYLGHCQLLMAADLNHDGTVDFVVEHMVSDPCTDTTVLLSAGTQWDTFASGTTFCPD
jgi:hypothetical protein